MRRRGLLVWLLLLVAAHGALTADPLVSDSTSSSTEPPTTTESMENRGNKKFGDKCESTQECGFRGSVCDPFKKSCQCLPDLPATNHIDKCGVDVAINESCFFNEQCENRVLQTECRDGKCWCRFELTPILNKQNTFECIAVNEPLSPESYVDPAMIGVLVGMALMFIIICVVLRLFSKARWRENRTIFNTPNPRLMNVSLLRDTKHPGERRGSRSSNRAPSRQPSMASLRPQSPNASQGSRTSRQGSRCSSGSARSPTKSIITNNYSTDHKHQPNDVNV